MPDVASLVSTTPLPPAPDGWRDYDYAVLLDGSLGLLRVDHDDRHLRLSSFDGVDEAAPTIVPMPAWPPRVDQFADGSWLVVATRCETGADNARVFSATGEEIAVFAAGDAVEHVHCAPDATIWLGYFDESRDWIGIAHVTGSGERLWGYNPAGCEPQIVDCCAVTLSDGVVWSCPWTVDHPPLLDPILRIDGHQARTWSNSVGGANALAVAGDHVLLAGGYPVFEGIPGDDQRARLALLRLEGNQAVLVGEARFEPVANASLCQGRGDTLHIVTSGEWSTVQVGPLIAALTPSD